MRSQPRSLKLLMATIVVLALNLALLRVALSHDALPVAAMVGSIGLAVQLGLLVLVHTPPGRRSFWVGFTSAGLVALVGTPCIIAVHYEFFGDLWVKYVGLLGSFFGQLPRPGAGGPAKLLHFAVASLFCFPAQLLLAIVGGILAANWPARLTMRSSGPAARAADLSR